MTDATPEMLAMAREIVAKIVEGDSDNLNGIPLRVAQANAYLSGGLDGNLSVRAVLAAIQATTESTAKLLADYDQAISPCPFKNPPSGQSYSPYDECHHCGANDNQHCRLEVTASYSLIKALRTHLKEQSK